MMWTALFTFFGVLFAAGLLLTWKGHREYRRLMAAERAEEHLRHVRLLDPDFWTVPFDWEQDG